MLILFFSVSMIILPAGADGTLSGDDSKFLADMNNEGIPLLFEIPAAMKAGIFHGDDSAIVSIGKEQSDALNAFIEKINGYSLSADLKQVRDQFLSSSEIYKKNLNEYSTLIKTCGSCITKMNEMYPILNGEAKKTMQKMILMYQATGTPMN